MKKEDMIKATSYLRARAFCDRDPKLIEVADMMMYAANVIEAAQELKKEAAAKVKLVKSND